MAEIRNLKEFREGFLMHSDIKEGYGIAVLEREGVIDIYEYFLC